MVIIVAGKKMYKHSNLLRYTISLHSGPLKKPTIYKRGSRDALEDVLSDRMMCLCMVGKLNQFFAGSLENQIRTDLNQFWTSTDWNHFGWKRGIEYEHVAFLQ